MDRVTGMAELDKNFSYAVTVFNVCPCEVSTEIPDLAAMGLRIASCAG
ncbi:hypothetical protein ACP70R_046811 [Stipagrostis hirtigluma subsp. patula]